MSKRPSRPWENGASSSEGVSCITVDGVKYFSDRFYLNRGVGDPPVTSSDECTCGARAPPPLLDRERLVASLDLKAAIVASYTVAPSYVIREYPSLFGPDSMVPTLVLHGHKGLSERMRENRQSQDSSHSAAMIQSKRTIADIKTENSDEKESSPRVKSEYDDDNDETGLVIVKEELEEEPPEDAWLRKLNEVMLSKKATFGKSVHLTEVLPTWISEEGKIEIESLRQEAATNRDNDDDDVIVLDSDDEETPVDTRYGVEQFVIQRRKRKQGVHHPKYMILFEKSGSVVVLITTANLTPQHAVDASWVQRFQASETKDIDKVTDAMRCDGSDFGYVLANYLECQSLAARPCEMVPEVFLKRYLGHATLDDFRQSYRWNSQVHLIATVPGEYRGPNTATHLGGSGSKKTFLYASQRVNDILCRLSGEKEGSQVEPWLPKSFLSNDDRLVMQPTSFGGLWKQSSLNDVVKLYSDHGTTNNDTPYDCRHDWLSRADIVWPSREFMAEIHRRARRIPRVPSPDSVTSSEMDDFEASDVTIDGNFCFLSSESFNTIDFACIARMCMFEPSYPTQHPSTRSPHIKSYARVFEGDEYQLRRRFGVEKAEETLSWYMLTSACLSRGAQGEATPHRPEDSDEMNFTNFELGVLFISRLSTDTLSNRVYCWKPSKCRCARHFQNEDSNVKMIHLPLPYRLRPHAYVQNEEEEAELCETPYFHEIPSGSGFIRNMRLTPLGASLAAKRF